MPVPGIKRGPGCVQKFVHAEMPHLMHKPGYSQKRALGASYSMARKHCSGERKHKGGGKHLSAKHMSRGRR